MAFTPSGTVTLVRPVFDLKAPIPMLSMSPGITVELQPKQSLFEAVSMIALQLFRLSNFGFLLSTVIRER